MNVRENFDAAMETAQKLARFSRQPGAAKFSPRAGRRRRRVDYSVGRSILELTNRVYRGDDASPAPVRNAAWGHACPEAPKIKLAASVPTPSAAL
jgi:hypothetical protein